VSSCSTAAAIRSSRILRGLGAGRLLLGAAGSGQDQGVLDVLLRQRGAALHLTARQVGNNRAQRAANVQGPVLIEAGILNRDDGVAHIRRDLAVGHRHAVNVVRVIVGNQAAGRVEDFRARRQLGQRRDLQAIEGLRGVPDGDARCSHQRQDDGAREQAGDGRQARDPGSGAKGHAECWPGTGRPMRCS
jgi:hypothetical protein